MLFDWLKELRAAWALPRARTLRHRKQTPVIALERLETRSLLSATPTLVTDINTVTVDPSSYPTQLSELGGRLFLVASTAGGDEALIVSDGTTAGTVVLRAFDNVGYLTNVNGTLFFSANDGTSGSELWTSDGTAAGTVRVADINLGAGNSDPRGLANVNGTLFFSANDGTSGSELWTSDGTAAGTVRVADINPGAGNAAPFYLTNVNGTLFFSANDGTSGNELWTSDGTAVGTVRVANINPGAADSFPYNLTNINGRLFFTADDGTSGFELWTSDGTAAGTTRVADINPGSGGAYPSRITNVNGRLFFIADDGISGEEVWTTDGTAAGTIRVADINPGIAGSNPSNLTNVNGTLFFTATDGISGKEVWRSDGTPAGTVRVADVNPGAADSAPAFLTNVNGRLFFTADDGISGFELWTSDGTAAGTLRVADINPGAADSVYTYFATLANVNGRLFFVANDGTSGYELWTSNGTAAGTTLVKNIIPPQTDSSDPLYLTEVSGRAFFSANDGTTGDELWVTDGTAAGTMLLADIFAGSTTYPGYYGYYGYYSGSTTINSSNPDQLVNVNGRLFFAANDGTSGDELWTSDGTAAGTTRVADIFAGVGSSNPYYLTNVNGRLFFGADDGINGIQLWTSDGTAAGTIPITDLDVGIAGSGRPLAIVNGQLFFAADDGVSGYELWTSDGTVAGTTLLADIFPGSGGSNPFYFTNVNGRLFFGADDGSGYELWTSDGTTAGTVRVADINPGMGGSLYGLYAGLTNVNGRLFFPANDGTSGYELWTSDGTAAGTFRVADINPGANGSIYPGYYGFGLANANGRLFFAANDGTSGYELWTSDGTAAGTIRVADINPGPESSFYYYSYYGIELANVNSRLFFAADDGISGHELWTSDGTAAGTVLVGDIDPEISSYPGNFVRVGSRLLFKAETTATGTELWSVDLSPQLAGASTVTYTENAAPAVINSTLTVDDFGSPTLATATITITNFVTGQDVLAFTNNGTTMGNIAVATNASGVLSLTSAGGTATLAQWQAALRSVTYANSSDNPNTTARSITFAVNDGAYPSTALASTVNVTAVNDAPVLTGTGTVNYAANGAPTPLNTSVAVTDLDSTTLTSATISITNFVAGQDLLAFTNNGTTMGNIAVATNANGVLTLTSAGGTATLAQWQAALRAVTFANSSATPNTTARSVEIVVNDGSSPSNVLASTINVTTTNSLPVLAQGSTLAYTENQTATPINTVLTVTDVDSATLASATVTITNFVAGQDVLGFVNDGATMGNIAVVSSLNGVLTLASDGGTATLAQWQAALRAVTYVNTSDNPDTTPRSVEFVVYDFVPASLDVVPGTPGASPIRPGFDTLSLPANDDSSQLTPLGFTINFFGVQYDSVYVNNNGNVTFNGPLSAYTPFNLLSTDMAIIAPFFGDVDTRQGNVVTFGQGVVDGHPAFAVNYVDVRHFNASGSPMDGLPTNSFQLVLIDRSDIAPGDFDIEFNYGNIAWEAGTASGGDAAGLGGTAARAGFSNGISTALEIPGSAINGAFLDNGPAETSLIHNSFNSTIAGQYVFQARNGTIDVGTASNTVSSTVNITAVNDPPRAGKSFVIVATGGGQTLAPSTEPLTAIVHLTTSDPDTPPDQLVYTVSNVTGGRFVLLSDRATPITNFTQADVDAERVAFIFDSTTSEPTFDLSVSDGTAGLPMMSVEAESPAPLTETALVDGVLYVVGSDDSEVVRIKQKGKHIVVKFKGGDTIKKDLSDVDEVVLMLDPGVEVKISKKVTVNVSTPDTPRFRVVPSDAAQRSVVDGNPSPPSTQQPLTWDLWTNALMQQLDEKIFSDTDWLSQV